MSDPIDTVYKKNNELSNFVIPDATTSIHGLMSSSDKEKLNGIQSGATANPTILNATTTVSGLMSASDKVKLNGIEEGATSNSNIPTATTSVSGLMSASDKAKLNGIADSANNYVLPTASTSTKGGVKVWTQGLSVSSGGYLQINAPILYPYSDRYMGAVIPGQGLELENPNTGEISVKLARYIEHYDSSSILSFTCAESFRWNNIVYNSNSPDIINQRMMLTKAGRLGIGVNPGYKLHVKEESTNDAHDAVAMFEGNGDTIVYIKGYNTGGYDEVGIVIKGNSAKDETWYMGTDDDTLGSLYFVPEDNEHISDSNIKVTFTRSGRVGIGTTDPKAPLHVYTQTSTSGFTGTIAYMYSGGEGFDYSLTTSEAYSLITEYKILAKNSIYSASDSRIKKNIVEIKDDISLKKLRDISCCSYNYINQLRNGQELQVGFIAQQVNNHFPEAVSLTENIIPNEMRIIENPQWTEINDGSNNKFKLTISDLQDVSGVKYRFYVSNDVSGNDEVKKETIGNSDNSFTFDNSYNNVFCYGKEVDDFHILDKQKLFALNFSATQEIDRIQQRQITELTEAKLKIQLLETQNSNLLTRLEALEKKINELS